MFFIIIIKIVIISIIIIISTIIIIIGILFRHTRKILFLTSGGKMTKLPELGGGGGGGVGFANLGNAESKRLYSTDPFPKAATNNQ